ncbi:hypothetical protein EON66_01410 [archaeon]|nr:MAG: hypothetical protein EON66_01410 [archaeon]
MATNYDFMADEDDGSCVFPDSSATDALIADLSTQVSAKSDIIHARDQTIVSLSAQVTELRDSLAAQSASQQQVINGLLQEIVYLRTLVPPSGTPSATPSASITPSVTPSSSITASHTPSSSRTPSQSGSITPSITSTASNTATASASMSSTSSPSASTSITPSVSASSSASASRVPESPSACPIASACPTCAPAAASCAACPACASGGVCPTCPAYPSASVSASPALPSAAPSVCPSIEEVTFMRRRIQELTDQLAVWGSLMVEPANLNSYTNVVTNLNTSLAQCTASLAQSTVREVQYATRVHVLETAAALAATQPWVTLNVSYPNVTALQQSALTCASSLAAESLAHAQCSARLAVNLGASGTCSADKVLLEASLQNVTSRLGACLASRDTVVAELTAATGRVTALNNTLHSTLTATASVNASRMACDAEVHILRGRVTQMSDNVTACVQQLSVCNATCPAYASSTTESMLVTASGVANVTLLLTDLAACEARNAQCTSSSSACSSELSLLLAAHTSLSSSHAALTEEAAANAARAAAAVELSVTAASNASAATTALQAAMSETAGLRVQLSDVQLLVHQLNASLLEQSARCSMFTASSFALESYSVALSGNSLQLASCMTALNGTTTTLSDVSATAWQCFSVLESMAVLPPAAVSGGGGSSGGSGGSSGGSANIGDSSGLTAPTSWPWSEHPPSNLSQCHSCNVSSPTRGSCGSSTPELGSTETPASAMQEGDLNLPLPLTTFMIVIGIAALLLGLCCGCCIVGAACAWRRKKQRKEDEEAALKEARAAAGVKRAGSAVARCGTRGGATNPLYAGGSVGSSTRNAAAATKADDEEHFYELSSPMSTLMTTFKAPAVSSVGGGASSALRAQRTRNSYAQSGVSRLDSQSAAHGRASMSAGTDPEKGFASMNPLASPASRMQPLSPLPSSAGSPSAASSPPGAGAGPETGAPVENRNIRTFAPTPIGAPMGLKAFASKRVLSA